MSGMSPSPKAESSSRDSAAHLRYTSPASQGVATLT